jgi:dipeptidyl aminopeptidase/acylaminoacyl peptidase
MKKLQALLAVLYTCAPALGEESKSFDAAAAFGARPSVSGMTLAPDGRSVAYLTPLPGQGSVLYTLSLGEGAKPKAAMSADGKPERLGHCSWVANDRLACHVYANLKDPTFGVMPVSRLLAVNADGTNQKLLSKRDSFYAHGVQLGGGAIIDSLPAENGAVLMTRVYVGDDRTGTRFGSGARGVGVDHIDTRTLDARRLEPPREDVVEYISDGRGAVRIVGLEQRVGASTTTQSNGVTDYLYREPGSQDWHKLSEYNSLERAGFNPYAVDPEHNVAYGLKKTDGRLAAYSVSLDGTLTEQLVYANPDVDVVGFERIGRQNRVVGALYITDRRHAFYFDPQIKQLLASLGRALPQHQLNVVDSSADENTLLIFAGSDSDPGVYYLFDKKARRLETFLVARGELEGVKLATVQSISYPAADGVMIPAYLTLPPGVTSAKGLPAIVLPHGGPSARDVWGFDWLSQFYASRGFVVLQPEFRGSFGYGDAWFQQNGFKSWKVAIGDVLAAGHWLVAQGMADPQKLGILGWSYGGYAALQSAVVEPGLFKAAVAIAPVTDLAMAKEEFRRTTGYNETSAFIGDGPHVREGSPLQNAARIKAPVLLFHAALDRNVSIEESKSMAERMKAVGGRCELVTWDDLDHYLDDSSARALMLRKSEAFLRQGFGM